ncbi:MAG: YdeI/OmpD-associated family protein, partial [Bacteroidales bacterium]|nr:YdeI/OmpD-associated family protein [Bacteroidales bacterium]
SKGGYQRFSPRRKKGNWTQLNIARCERLEKLGLMTDAGLAVMPKTAFEVASHITEALQECPIVWKNYQKQPEIYKRVRIDNIQSWYGFDDELYKRRLQKFIDNTREGKLYGDWHDGGRLHEQKI